MTTLLRNHPPHPSVAPSYAAAGPASGSSSSSSSSSSSLGPSHSSHPVYQPFSSGSSPSPHHQQIHSHHSQQLPQHQLLSHPHHHHSSHPPQQQQQQQQPVYPYSAHPPAHPYSHQTQHQQQHQLHQPPPTSHQPHHHPSYHSHPSHDAHSRYVSYQPSSSPYGSGSSMPYHSSPSNSQPGPPPPPAPPPNYSPSPSSHPYPSHSFPKPHQQQQAQHAASTPPSNSHSVPTHHHASGSSTTLPSLSSILNRPPPAHQGYFPSQPSTGQGPAPQSTPSSFKPTSQASHISQPASSGYNGYKRVAGESSHYNPSSPMPYQQSRPSSFGGSPSYPADRRDQEGRAVNAPQEESQYAPSSGQVYQSVMSPSPASGFYSLPPPPPQQTQAATSRALEGKHPDSPHDPPFATPPAPGKRKRNKKETANHSSVQAPFSTASPNMSVGQTAAPPSQINAIHQASFLPPPPPPPPPQEPIQSFSPYPIDSHHQMAPSPTAMPFGPGNTAAPIMGVGPITSGGVSHNFGNGQGAVIPTGGGVSGGSVKKPKKAKRKLSESASAPRALPSTANSGAAVGMGPMMAPPPMQTFPDMQYGPTASQGSAYGFSHLEPGRSFADPNHIGMHEQPSVGFDMMNAVGRVAIPLHSVPVRSMSGSSNSMHELPHPDGPAAPTKPPTVGRGKKDSGNKKASNAASGPAAPAAASSLGGIIPVIPAETPNHLQTVGLPLVLPQAAPSTGAKLKKKNKKKKLSVNAGTATGSSADSSNAKQPSPSAAAAAAVLSAVASSSWLPSSSHSQPQEDLMELQQPQQPAHFGCRTCGKVYKNASCLAKHEWEHSEYWVGGSSSNYINGCGENGSGEHASGGMTKHQQAVLLQAASILVGFGEAAVQHNVDRGSLSPSSFDARSHETFVQRRPQSPGGEVWNAVLRRTAVKRRRSETDVDDDGEFDEDHGTEAADIMDSAGAAAVHVQANAGVVVTPPVSSPSRSPTGAMPLLDGLSALSAAVAALTETSSTSTPLPQSPLSSSATKAAAAAASALIPVPGRKRGRAKKGAAGTSSPGGGGGGGGKAPASPVTAALTEALVKAERAGSAVAGGTLRELVKARKEGQWSGGVGGGGGGGASVGGNGGVVAVAVGGASGGVFVGGGQSGGVGGGGVAGGAGGGGLTNGRSAAAAIRSAGMV